MARPNPSTNELNSMQSCGISLVHFISVHFRRFVHAIMWHACRVTSYRRGSVPDWICWETERRTSSCRRAMWVIRWSRISGLCRACCQPSPPMTTMTWLTAVNQDTTCTAALAAARRRLKRAEELNPSPTNSASAAVRTTTCFYGAYK